MYRRYLGRQTGLEWAWSCLIGLTTIIPRYSVCIGLQQLYIRTGCATIFRNTWRCLTRRETRLKLGSIYNVSPSRATRMLTPVEKWGKSFDKGRDVNIGSCHSICIKLLYIIHPTHLECVAGLQLQVIIYSGLCAYIEPRHGFLERIRIEIITQIHYIFHFLVDAIEIFSHN